MGIEHDNNNTTYITEDNPFAYDQLDVTADQDGDWDQDTYNANLRHEIGDNGSAIVFDVDFSKYDNPDFVRYDNTYMDVLGNNVFDPTALRNTMDINVDIFAAK